MRQFNQIEIGMSGQISKFVTEQDIVAFSEITGDKNAIHLDPNFAAGTIFGKRISHGMLIASFISTVFGSHFPGDGWIYVNQTLNFKAPVFIGDLVDVCVTVKKLLPKKKMVQFETVASVEKKIVVSGSATLLGP